MLYEFECPEHGYLELRMTIAEMEEHDASGNCVCPECSAACERLVSVPQIEPDSFWSGNGQFKNLKEFKDFNRNHFDPTRSNIEQVHKNKASRRRATEKRRHDTIVDIVRNLDNP